MLVITSFSCQTRIILKERKHWETIFQFPFFRIYIFRMKVLFIKLYCILTKKTSVYYTVLCMYVIHNIKMESVILRLQMIQCNLTCGDSTGSMRVTKNAVELLVLDKHFV